METGNPFVLHKTDLYILKRLLFANLFELNPEISKRKYSSVKLLYDKQKPFFK